MARVRERSLRYERELRRVGRRARERESSSPRSRAELASTRSGSATLEAEMQAAQSSLDRVAPAARRGRASSPAKSCPAWPHWKSAAAAAMLHRAAHRGDGRRGCVAARKLEGADRGRRRGERNSASRRTSLGRAGSRSGRPSAKRRSSAIGELQEELQAVRARLAELEEALKAARDELDAARDRRGELGGRQARLQSDAQHMAETCIQELSQPREELLADETLPASPATN